MEDDLAQVIGDRPGWTWTGDGALATFRPEGSWWSAVVRRPAIPPRASQRWHIAIIHPDGNAAFTDFASSAGEAIRLAEHGVRSHPD